MGEILKVYPLFIDLHNGRLFADMKNIVYATVGVQVKTTEYINALF